VAGPKLQVQVAAPDDIHVRLISHVEDLGIRALPNIPKQAGDYS